MSRISTLHPKVLNRDFQKKKTFDFSPGIQEYKEKAED
jgi:hypothetical protein